MSYNNDSTSHPEKQVNLVQIAQEVVQDLLLSYNPEPLPPDADGLYHYIYITWRRDTYKFYVGKHSSKNPATDSYIGSGLHMLRAIEKHGASSFEHRILQYTLTAQEAFDLEAAIVTEDYIKLYKDELQITYNLVGGGWGQGVISEETRVKHIEVKRKYYRENPEALEKLSKARDEKLKTEDYRKKLSDDAKHRFENNPQVRVILEMSTQREMVSPYGFLFNAHKDDVLGYLKQGYFLTIQQVKIHNPSLNKQNCINMFQKGKDYRVKNTLRLIELLENGWVLGHLRS
jgi:hypothetical protein